MCLCAACRTASGNDLNSTLCESLNGVVLQLDFAFPVCVACACPEYPNPATANASNAVTNNFFIVCSFAANVPEHMSFLKMVNPLKLVTGNYLTLTDQNFL